MDTFHITSAQDNAAGNYRQVGYISVEDVASRVTQLGMLALITTAMGFAFVSLARNLGELPANFHVGPLEVAIGLIAFIATVVAQEWMHVLVLRRYGANPRFGIGRNGILYITVPDYCLRRNSLIMSALTPFVALTLLGFLGIWLFQGTPWVALFALIAVANAAASTSDLLAVGLLLRYPSTAWTVDDGHGMRVLMPME